MTTYRTGRNWGVTIVREGTGPRDLTDPQGGRRGDELVAVVVNGDQALAERICALLNADDGLTVARLRRPDGAERAAESLIADLRICVECGRGFERVDPDDDVCAPCIAAMASRATAEAELARWHRGMARAEAYVARYKDVSRRVMIGEALAIIRAVVDGTDVNA